MSGPSGRQPGHSLVPMTRCRSWDAVVRSVSHVWLFVTPWTAAHQASMFLHYLPVCSNSCPLSPWCHPTISFSATPFSSCPQSFTASQSFQMSHLFTSGVQSIGVSASKSVLSMNTQDWSPLRWIGSISLQSKVLSRVFSNITVQKHQFFGAQLLHSQTFTSIHEYWKNHSLH